MRIPKRRDILSHLLRASRGRFCLARRWQRLSKPRTLHVFSEGGRVGIVGVRARNSHLRKLPIST